MPKSWAKQVDEALDVRLAALAQYFSQVKPEWLVNAGRDRLPSWIVDDDIRLFHELTVRWQPGVTDQVFRRVWEETPQEELRQRLAEEVVAMRRLGSWRSKSVLRETEEWSASDLVARRLMVLLRFHRSMIRRLTEREALDVFLKRQELQARNHFPKLIDQDLLLLSALARWRISLSTTLRHPLVEKAFSGRRLDAIAMLHLPSAVQPGEERLADLTRAQEREADPH